MQFVKIEELINLKILPFNLYNQKGDLIFSEGEFLTPGKLLQLRYMSVIYRDDEIDLSEDSEEYEEIEIVSEVDEVTEKRPSQEKTKSSDKKAGIINPKNVKQIGIPERSKNVIQSLYTEALSFTIDQNSESEIYIEVRDKIIEETLPVIDNIVYKSDLKIIGEFDQVHGINVAILSAALASKLKFNEAQIKDVTLAALLHDIGMLRIPKEVLDKTTLTAKEQRVVQLHPQIGYRIIKKEMKLPEHIARVALEHHEKNDGSGYPFGISSGLISILSQVISICNFYDEIMANRSNIKVKNAKEAVKAMMAIGSKAFTPSILYTFVYMANYNDTTPVDGLIT